MVTVGGVRIGLTGATYEDSPRAFDPGDLKFAPSVATLIEQARTLKREGADFVVAVAHVARERAPTLSQRYDQPHPHRPHPHLFINYRSDAAITLIRALRHRHRRGDRRRGGGRQAPLVTLVAASFA